MRLFFCRCQSYIRCELKKWNAFELAWLALFSSAAILMSIISGDNFLGLLVFLTGVLCVVLTAKGKLSAYVFGMVNTLGYAWISYSNHLFGEMGLNLFFFVPTNIIGFILWRKNIKSDAKLTMRKMKAQGIFLTGLLCVAGIAGLGIALSTIGSQNTPYIDAATNVFSIMATILTIQRYREQWLLYLILNAFTIVMWGIRAASGSGDGPLMVVMWTAYLINACYGYWNWSKGAKEGKACTPTA